MEPYPKSSGDFALMKQMTSAQVRQTYLNYFESQGHRQVPSSSLVPGNDPTLLFTNSGMVQFKEAFLGLDKRDYTRATTSQKCLRVSGKHNDLEEVGSSLQHHTFFEMLGNFSFGGDYFKREAIRYAWDLLTNVYGLPEDRLAITIYQKDDESHALWIEEAGIDPARIARLGPDDNFWQMAETGPCGPNTEIHWDQQPGAGVESIIPSLLADDGRFLEIWNLVFMQFNRTQSDPEHSGQYDELLPNPGVDTGMGLERMTRVLCDVESTYQTDLFLALFAATQALTGANDRERDANIVPYRVIADHTRAAVFLIADGVMPGPKGRDSVCRVVIRRAARFGRKLGLREPFLGTVAQAVIDTMGSHYTELHQKQDVISATITREEERFLQTLDTGLNQLDSMLGDLPPGHNLSGDKAFFLKATLGLPIEVTKDIAEESGYGVDMAGFENAEDHHALVSGGGKAMGVMASAEAYAELLDVLQSSGTLGKNGVQYKPYGDTSIETRVLAISQDGVLTDTLKVGEQIEVTLSQTPFYVESGGQVSDTGSIKAANWEVSVTHMNQPVSGLILHVGKVISGTATSGDMVQAIVDRERRFDIQRNHTGTHLLHAALRRQLGNHVQQKGSLVAPDRLRFDFSHPDKVTPQQLHQIQAEINDHILVNLPVADAEKPLSLARQEGAIALFGEKYGDMVRTVVIQSDNGDMPYSYELCGGTHVAETGEIGAFVFTHEGSVSAGTRRVEALTGRSATQFIETQLNLLHAIAEHLGTTPDQVLERIQSLQHELNHVQKERTQLQRSLAKVNFDRLLDQLEIINGKSALIAHFEDVPMDTMREMADWFRNRVDDNGILVLGNDMGGKPQLIVSVTDNLIQQGVKAGDLVKPIAAIVGGSGGGRPSLAQAGGKDSSKLPEAMAKARELIHDL